jgi:hypothetical protein
MQLRRLARDEGERAGVAEAPRMATWWAQEGMKIALRGQRRCASQVVIGRVAGCRRRVDLRGYNRVRREI